MVICNKHTISIINPTSDIVRLLIASTYQQLSGSTTRDCFLCKRYSVGVNIPLKIVSNDTVTPFSHIFLYNSQHCFSFCVSNCGFESPLFSSSRASESAVKSSKLKRKFICVKVACKSTTWKQCG